MKKTLFINLMLIVMAIILPQTVFAATGDENDPHVVNTVDELTTAFKNGGYVKMNADIDVGEFTGNKLVIATDKTVTLDLNGYTLSGKNNDEKVSTALISNNGTLIINDNSAEKDGKITMDDTGVRCYTWGHGIFAINNSGTLTVNNGTIENIGSTDVPYAIDNNTTVRSAKITINDGTISADVCAIRAFANSITNTNDIIVNGGKIEAGSSAIWLQQPSEGKASKASLLVTGGEISAEKSYAIYADVNNSDAADALSITITGGVIENNSDTRATVNFVPRSGDLLDSAPINFTISGGTIINNNPAGPAILGAEYSPIITDGIKVTGGIFSSDVSEYLDTTSGISSFTDEDGMFHVGMPRKVVIENTLNGEITSSLGQAIEGQKVTLVATPADEYELSKITVVDSNNKEIKVENGVFIMPSTEVTITAEFEKILYSVKIEDTANGKVTASLSEAVKGETVKLTVTPDTGYELSKVTVLNDDKNEIEVVDGSFIMPTGGVTVVAEFKKIPVVDFVVPEDKTENNNIGIVENETIKETLNSSLKADTELNKKVEEAKANGEDVVIEIKVGELAKDEVKEEEKQKILQTVAANQKVHQYFDISVLVRTQEAELGKIKQLTEKMKFSMEISKDLIQEGRKFYIIKLHGDEVKRIEATLNGTKLEFETDQFSTFALAYEDVETGSGVPGIPQPPTEEKDETPLTNEKDETPKTGTINIPVYVWITLAGIAVVGIVTTKKSSKHSR